MVESGFPKMRGCKIEIKIEIVSPIEKFKRKVQKRGFIPDLTIMYIKNHTS